MKRSSKVSLSPVERKAEFVKHATLRQKSLNAAAEEDVGASWTHLRECFAGVRTPSKELAEKAAEFCGMTSLEFWGDLNPVAVAV